MRPLFVVLRACNRHRIETQIHMHTQLGFHCVDLGVPCAVIDHLLQGGVDELHELALVRLHCDAESLGAVAVLLQMQVSGAARIGCGPAMASLWPTSNDAEHSL